jgi:hypothetical protein
MMGAFFGAHGAAFAEIAIDDKMSSVNPSRIPVNRGMTAAPDPVV